jgi:hypothetical protein
MSYRQRYGRIDWKRKAGRGHILSLREQKRHQHQRENDQLSFEPIKVTPRREKDFTGKAWSRLNV